jgi:lambda repressor-like predicted transcriptional regulator
MSTNLISEYRDMIEPILPLAKKAYGSREQTTPAHDASREYTRLLTEFHTKGGSLPQLAKELDVAYAGIRRRVVMKDVSVSTVKPRTRAKTEELSEAVSRVKTSKALSVDEYHDQLAKEYESGVSLAALARSLGLSSAAPLYYGVQRSLQRRAE